MPRPPRRYPPPGPFAQYVAQPKADTFIRGCCIIPCGRPTAARAGKGLSVALCRYHTQLKNRHGDPRKGTYSAATLIPYRRAAASFLNSHAEDFWVIAALNALRITLENAGPRERLVDVIQVFSPSRKARDAFARLRSEGVPPLRLLVNHLAVTLALREDPVRPFTAFGPPDDYRLTQIGKAAMRMASGEHFKYWDGGEHHRYPRSSGKVLRFIGRTIDRACEHVAYEHGEAILTLKVKRYGAWPKA